MSRPPPDLPLPLARAIDTRLEGRPHAPLRERARRLSESYRARKSTRETIRDETDALAYALTRMPATYAAIGAVLGRLAEEQPGFAPRRLLDAGCGLGAAAYAARGVWPGLSAVTLLDRSAAFLALARALMAESGDAPLEGAETLEADLLRLPETDGAPHDLIVAGYALTEIAEGALPVVVDALWARTGGALVIVEPGTPRDHARLLVIRDRLIGLGAKPLAPCPHEAPCPMTAPDWCHFSARLPRRRAHRLLKGAEAPFEDEKFAYLAVSREGGARAAARVVAPARVNKVGMALKLCTDKALCETFVPKRDKAGYERMRRKNWGDPLEAPAEDNG